MPVEYRAQLVTPKKRLRLPFTSTPAWKPAVTLNGRAYNGMFFDVADNGDPFVQGRQSAIRLALPAAVFQSAQQSGNLTDAFVQNSFAGLSERVYVSYPVV